MHTHTHTHTHSVVLTLTLINTCPSPDPLTDPGDAGALLFAAGISLAQWRTEFREGVHARWCGDLFLRYNRIKHLGRVHGWLGLAKQIFLAGRHASHRTNGQLRNPVGPFCSGRGSPEAPADSVVLK